MATCKNCGTTGLTWEKTVESNGKVKWWLARPDGSAHVRSIHCHEANVLN